MAAGGTWIGGSRVTSASPEAVWAVWTDPSRCPGGPIESASLHGSFSVGRTYTTCLKGQRPLTSTITLLDEPHIWTSVAKTAGLTLCVEHVIETAPGGTRLTERLQFS